MTSMLPLRHHSQTGFTLIELMMSMTIGLILMMVLASLFIDAIGNADAMMNKAELNRQARMMFDIVALGGFRTGVNISTSSAVTPATDVNYKYIFGLRGRNNVEKGDGWSIPSDLRSGVSAWGPPQDTFGLPPTDAAISSFSQTVQESDVLSSDTVPTVTVTCTGTNQPVFGCVTGQDMNVTGYLRMTTPNTRGFSQNIQEVVFDLYNPLFYGNNHVADDEISTVYWTALTNLIDQVPP